MSLSSAVFGSYNPNPPVLLMSYLESLHLYIRSSVLKHENSMNYSTDEGT